jgi:hypothetical protein
MPEGAPWIRWTIARTPEEKRACYRLRAREYGRYYRNIPDEEFADKLDRETLPDGSPRALLILVYGPSGPLATARLVIVRHPSVPGLRAECEELTDFDLEREMPHANAIVAEKGKLAVARGENHKAIKRILCEAVGETARRFGVELIVALAPPLVDASLRKVGAIFRRVEGARLRRETAEQLRYLLTYHDYFLPMFGKRGLDVAPERLACYDNTELLRALVADCPDGPSVYTLTTEDYLEGMAAARPAPVQELCVA